MSAPHLLVRLFEEAFLQEIHHLLWLEPFVNRGVYDAGWSCRDHAFIVAGLLACEGLPAEFVNGKASYVRGPSADGPPHEIGQDARDPQVHTWLEVGDIGIVDLSPNPAGRWRTMAIGTLSRNLWRSVDAER